jgi:hypothetical protein
VPHFDLIDSRVKRKNDLRVLAALLWTDLVLSATAAAAPAPADVTTSSADTEFANFAFASEVGSGVYQINGQTMQVYQLHPGWRLRDADRPGQRPGLRLIVPVTVGFFNFNTQDLVHLDFPNQIGALSIEPGAELDYWLHEDWHVYPYAKAGATVASDPTGNAWIYGTGVRSDYRFSVLDGAGLYRADLTYAGVHYRNPTSGTNADGTVIVPLRNDSFTRLRNGAELRHGFGAPLRERRWEAGLYGVTDIYLNAPSGPASGISARTLQFEAGVMLGLNPMYQLWGVALPRIGIGYRDAGVLSGWRLVLGEPF